MSAETGVVVAAVVIGVVLFGLFFLGSSLGWFEPARCDVCRTTIKRKSYTWERDGKKIRMCPNCNRSVERKKSKQAVDDFLKQ